MSEDTAAAENNEEISKEKRIAEGIFNLIKDIELLDENNIPEELFNRFSFYINQIDEIESLVYEELGNLLNDGNKSQSDFVNLEEEAFRVYEIRNRNFLILLAEFIARNKYINKKFFYELTLSQKDNKNILLHSIYRESSLGNFLDREKYAKTKTNDILWICQTLDGLCKEVEKAKLNESQNLSDKEQYLNFSKGLWAFALRKEFISEELFYDLIFGKLAYDNELCDFAVFFKRVQEGNISFSLDETQNGFKFNLSSFHDSGYAENFNIVFGKVAEIYSFAQRKFGTKANEFTNYLCKNLSFEELQSLNVNSFRRKFNRWSVSRIIRNNDLSVKKLFILHMISQKCWFWVINRTLQEIIDIMSNLPIDQVDDFCSWLYENKNSLITRNGLVNNFREQAQDNGFISREQQEELLQLVPSERQNEYLELFRDRNFRKFYQTPQAIKNSLIVGEIYKLGPIEYIAECKKNVMQDEDIRTALDTFDMNKINEILEDKFNQLPSNVRNICIFRIINEWFRIISEVNKIDKSILSEENKNELFKYPQIACAERSRIEQFLYEMRTLSILKDNFFKYIDKIFSKEAIYDVVKNLMGDTGFDDVETCAKNFLKKFGYEENVAENETFANSYAMLATVNFTDQDYFDNILPMIKPSYIVNLLEFAMQKNDLQFYKHIMKELNAEELSDTKIEVIKIIIEQKQNFITEAFENDSVKLKQFCELIKTDNIFYFINSKDDVLILFELLKSGIDITKINVLDFDKIKLVMQNVNVDEKEQFYNAFAELSQKVYSDYIFEFFSNLEREKLNIGENILKLNELSKVGLNISNTDYVSFNDFTEINLMLENKNEYEKNKLCQIFAEFSKKKFFLGKTINFLKTIDKGIEENNLSEKNYACLGGGLSSSKLVINSNPKLLADFLFFNFEPDKLADIFILLEELISKNKCFEFADDFKCHLGAHPKVAEALATEENIPKLEAVINRTEARAQ